MARDDYDDRERSDRARDDRYGQDNPPGRAGGSDRDPYGGALYGQARGREQSRDQSRDRYQGTGDERDLGYGDDSSPRRDRLEGSRRGGVGGGMGRDAGGGYAGRPEDAARPVRYDRDDYEDGSSRQGLRGGRGEGAGRDAGYDRDDARYDAYGAEGGMRDRGRGGTMGGSMGGNAGWRDPGRDWHRDAGPMHGGGRDRSAREWDQDRERWAREQWERSMHGDPRWESDYRGGSGSTGGGLQRGLQSGGTMGDFSGSRDYRSEYGHEYGREGNYGHGGGGISGRPGGADETRHSGGNWFTGSHGGTPDRNPGQGFGGLGYSNADVSNERPGWNQHSGHGAGRDYAARDHTGRGPRNDQRSDERIREDVCERLTRHREIDASDIDIDVREGVVTLSGHVEDKHAKRLAEDVAEEVMGVVEVRNELKAARGGVLGALFGRGHRHEAEDRSDREVTRDATRDPARNAAGTAGHETSRETGRESTRGSARDTARDARTGGMSAAPPSDLGSVGVTTVGPSGAAGAVGARNASEPTTPDASPGRGEPRRGRGSNEA